MFTFWLGGWNFKPSIHHQRSRSVAIKLRFHSSLIPLQTFGAGVDHPLSKRDNPDLKESAISFLQSHLGVNPETISYKSGYSGETARHVYVKQTHVRVFLLRMQSMFIFFKKEWYSYCERCGKCCLQSQE